MRSRVTVPLVLELPQNKLPTELQALGHYLWLKQQEIGKYSAPKLALATARAITKIWNEAFIPCSAEQNIMRQLYFRHNSVIKR